MVQQKLNNRIQNFLNYRKQCFENFLSLYTLFKHKSNYKKFIKLTYRKRINFYCHRYIYLLAKRKIYLKLFAKEIFLYSVHLNIFIEEHLITFLINKLRYMFLVYVNYKKNLLIISNNNYPDFLKILNFIDFLRNKLNSNFKVLEVTNLIIKSPRLLYTYNLYIYSKFGLTVELFNKIKHLILLNQNNLILCQVYFLCFYCYLLILLFQIYNNLFKLIFYGHFTPNRERL